MLFSDATKLNKVWAITLKILEERSVVNGPRSLCRMMDEVHVQGDDQRVAYTQGGMYAINKVGGTINLEFANNKVYFFASESVTDRKKLEANFVKFAQQITGLDKTDTLNAASSRFGYKLDEAMQEANDYEKACLLADAATYLIHIHTFLLA